MKIESLRLESHERKPRNQKMCKSSSSSSEEKKKKKKKKKRKNNRLKQKSHEVRDQNKNHEPRR